MNVHPAATETFLFGSYCDYWRGVYLSLWRHSIRIYTAYLLHNSTEAGGLLPLTPSPCRVAMSGRPRDIARWLPLPVGEGELPANRCGEGSAGRQGARTTVPQGINQHHSEPGG